MIKRRFYKEEHADLGGASSSYSDDDDDDNDNDNGEDSDTPPGIDGKEVPEEEHLDEEEKELPLYPSSGSGYQSEDSSVNEVGCDSSGRSAPRAAPRPAPVRSPPKPGLPVYEEESSEGGVVHYKQSDTHAEKIQRPSKTVANESSPKYSVPDLDSCVLKFKSVFKCRLCPRIVCLNETTVRAHLSSKRHALSKKLLEKGRLKLMLNSDGEIEEEQETHAERHARTVALAQETDAQKSRDKGQKRQRKRSKKKLRDATCKGISKDTTKKPSKKCCKTEG